MTFRSIGELTQELLVDIRRKMEANRVKCPRCGGEPQRNETRYGTRLSCCGLWAWGEYPLADAETHEARKAAHAAFDKVWRDGRLSRSAAYRYLAREMRMTHDECHVKLMNAAQARRVVEIAERMKEKVA